MKLLVSDFDGTYYLDDNDIKKNNLCIKDFQDKGNLFMLSSGRSFKSLKEVTRKYNISYDYLSCCDGSILYDKFDNIIAKFDLEPSILEEFLTLKDYANIKKIQHSYPDDYYDTMQNGEMIGCNIVIENINITNTFLDKYYKMQEKYPNYDFLVYSYNDITYFCLKNKGINKGSAILTLKDKLGLINNNIYTVGDNENDYSMLKLFNGYYIGDASNKIKDVCLKGYNSVSNLIMEILKSAD